MSKFNIDAYCVAITTNLEENKTYILSTTENSIEFPVLEIDTKNANSIDNSLIDHMRKFLMTSQFELSPQIVSANSTIIKPRKKNTINLVYSFLIKENVKNFDSHWISFNFQNPSTEYAGLIFEVIQKLK